uniref:Uncharacterized protein n=1 Tax=Parastrongyloides trichosuri TaxID=131310 RepID=A0A0N5A0N4_PARTI
MTTNNCTSSESSTNMLHWRGVSMVSEKTSDNTKINVTIISQGQLLQSNVVFNKNDIDNRKRFFDEPCYEVLMKKSKISNSNLDKLGDMMDCEDTQNINCCYNDYK